MRNTANRYKKLLEVFMRSKRAILGLGIIGFFGVLAIFAPTIASYNPTGDTWLAGSGSNRAKPIWFKTILGMNTLSENMAPVKDSEFTNPVIHQEWNVSTNSDYITVGRITSIGTSGSALVTYDRRNTETPSTAQMQLSTTFSFPYGGPPARFEMPVQILTENADNVPIEIRVFIEDPNVQKRYEWGFGVDWDFTSSTATTNDWVVPSPPIASGTQITVRMKHFGTPDDLAELMFSSAGNYTFGLTITFRDIPAYAGKNVRSMVYIDNLDLKLYGSAFGLLGCDWQGRDIFSQLVYGARISMIVGLLAAGISVFLGLLVGLVSGYLGGLVDEGLMRFTDALLVLPGLPLLIVLIAVLGTSISNIILILGFLGWMGFARVVRSQVLSLKERPFVEAAKAIGAGKGHIILRHIVPNVMSLVYVTLATSVPGAIVGEAALSWLGYFDPYTMSWGRMLNDVQTHSGYTDWWWVLPPGLCIAAISVAFILLGYALDEVLNPRLRVRR
jgi:peptide/nickel transport system permease protein